MKYKIFLTTIITTLVANFSFSAPHIKNSEKVMADGRTAFDRSITLHTARLIMHQCSLDGKKAVKKKWEDYFFGLEFGRMKKTNGGWSIWNFLSCFEYNRGVNNLIATFMPESVTLNEIRNSVMVDLVYPSMDGGKLKIRMIQYTSHPNWLFLRVTAENFNLWRLDFNAYPGNSNSPRDRERHLRVGTQDYNLGETPVKQLPESPFIAMYNKFVQDNAGCLLVYEPEKYSELVAGKTDNGIILRFMVKKNVREFHFALGQFTEKPANDMVNRFMTEDGDSIKSFLKSINWEPALPTDQFEKSIIEAKKLGVSEDKLKVLENDYMQAVKNKNSVAASKVLDKLEKTKQNILAKGLEAFR